MASQKQALDNFCINNINDEKSIDETVGMEGGYLSYQDKENQHWNKAKVSGNSVKKLFEDPLPTRIIICLKMLIT